MNFRSFLTAAVAWMGSASKDLGLDSWPKNFNKIMRRWDWRRGPSPKRGSRRWRLMMARRIAPTGPPTKYNPAPQKHFKTDGVATPTSRYAHKPWPFERKGQPA